jgi:hypothetical protein
LVSIIIVCALKISYSYCSFFCKETTVEFDKAYFEVNESDKFISLPIERRGDLSNEIQIECLMQDETALNNLDYIVRNKNGANYQLVRIMPGESLGYCDIQIIDDEVLEQNTETFKAILLNPSNGVKIGSIAETKIAILGPNDGN